MRLDLLFPVVLPVLLGFVLVVAGYNGQWGVLHLILCVSAAAAILYVSRTRADYLWLSALGGIVLILTPPNPALIVTGPLWPDVISVAVFVAYYKWCIVRSRTPVHSGGSHGSPNRAR